ncbi:Tryptophan aminotransferase-related protein 2 [Dichanthelium oligosanthes]|uniref:Tryptophan aminotransferase-related protein 2 n=1 Tax=Dichanthelium oligosanthes TaxID=888268 RepID=A0A1E5VHE3_9POAL|nr:Tryptophan aminotransferase-related protein 2 [Dichanthelium oligosanthes]
MAALRRLGTAVDGNFQGATGGMVPPPSPRILTPNGRPSAPNRREEGAVANGGGSSPGLAALRPTKKAPRGKVYLATAGGKPGKRAPFWQAALVVSIVLNIWLFLHPYVNDTAHPPHHHLQQEHQEACLTHPDAADRSAVDSGRRRARLEEPVPKAWAAGAPSTGKPAVTPDSVINLDHGDPTMFEEFWRGTGDAAEIVIPGWQTMSYFSDVGNVCWFMEPGFNHEVRRLHRLVGNAAVDGYHVLVGTGSTQLFMAALYALSPPADTNGGAPMSVVSTAPYYSSYPAVTDFLQSGLFRWAGDANSFKGDTYIELVCSPNNPDGTIREAVLSSDSGIAVHDLAYYWPQYTPITKRADHDIMLFTVSKSTGHAGTRIGWALVKDRDVAKKMTKFIELNTIGVSKDSQLRAAKVLKAVSDAYEMPEGKEEQHRLFDYGRRKMVERWSMLREAAATSGIFSLPEETSAYCNFANETASTNPAFAWLRCDREDVEDCASFLRGHKILTRSGSQFGADPRYVRVSMLDRDDAYDIFVKRLSSLK